MDVMGWYRRARKFALEHLLFEVILILFVPKVESMLAAHETADVKVLLDV
jgi:hypothetical protein